MFGSTECWCNIWRETYLCFQKWHEEFSKFSPEHVWKSKNWNFDGILLSKVENLWAQNLQGSFVSWQWRMIQNLKRNWLVSSKLTWGIWWILTRALENLKNLHFNGLLLTKVYNVWAKKSTEELCLMALKIDAKFEGKLTCAFKNDSKVSKLGFWWDPFIQSRKYMSLKFMAESIVMAMKNNAKFEEELMCQFKIDLRILTNFHPSIQISKIAL